MARLYSLLLVLGGVLLGGCGSRGYMDWGELQLIYREQPVVYIDPEMADALRRHGTHVKLNPQQGGWHYQLVYLPARSEEGWQMLTIRENAVGVMSAHHGDDVYRQYFRLVESGEVMPTLQFLASEHGPVTHEEPLAKANPVEVRKRLQTAP